MKLPISRKLPLLMIFLGAIATGLTAFMGYNAGRSALIAESEDKLNLALKARSDQLTTLFTDVQNHVGTMALNPATLEALEAFSKGWGQIKGDTQKHLQSAYITGNQHPVGERQKLDRADDIADSGDFSYNNAHNRFHKFFRSVLESKDYYDIFLIDGDGNIVYSVFKETDFATNLANGQWSSSSLAQVYNAARNAAPADGPVASDYATYGPSNGAPAAFSAIALRDWMGNVQGVLAFQLPSSRINAALQSRAGMGETGRTYVVGADFLMRNDMTATPENDVLAARQEIAPVTRALGGEAGIMTVPGEDGQETLAAYAPIAALGTTWAIVAEQDVAEMLHAVDAMRDDLLLVSLVILLVVSVTGILFSRSISKPLNEIQAAMGSVAERNYQTVIPGTTRQDEVGAISRALGEMQSKFEQVEAGAQVSIFKGAAFDSCAAAMMMIDRDFRVTQANDAALALLREHRETLQTVWPNFNVDDIIGTCIDIFHKNPDHQRRMLSDPSRLPHRADITVADLKIELNISAIHDEDGAYVGNALEWSDVSEARTNSGILKSISENQCIVEYSLDGTILSANENFATLMGAPATDLCGRHHSEFVEPQEKGSEAYAEFWRKLKAGKFVAGKFTRVGRSGSEVTIRGSYNTIMDGNGAPYKIVEVATDITELNRAAEERQLTLDAIGKMQAMIEFETDGTIRSANQNFQAATGYTQDEIVGKHHSMFLSEQDRQSQDYRDFWEALSQGKTKIGIFRRVGKDGNEIHLQAVYCPVPDKSGKILRVIKCASDVTAEELERQRISEERAEQEAAQAHVVSALSDGLGKLSAGDLTAIINQSFAAEYEQLRFDFNAACEKLMSVMSEVALKTHGISSGAGQITQSADDLAKRTENQAASLEETASAIEEMTASVKLATERAETAETATETAKRNAEVSESVVKETIEAMTQIDRSSEQISQIIGVIDDIAFQTNLLALNAGVEAARAGDAGRGFAVVASEVRALAQRCSDAAKEIKGLISESGEHVKHGVDLVGRTGTSLEEIIKSVVEVSGLVGGMFSSSKEQSIGLTEINSAVSQLDQVTQQNAAMVEESTAACHELTSDAHELARLIGRFRINDDAMEDMAWKEAEQNSARRDNSSSSAGSYRSAGATALKPVASESVEDWEDF